MAGENPSTGGDNEVEYIPFYGELRMTTFTTDDRKEATKAKRIKTIKEKPHTEEAAIAAAEMLVEQVEATSRYVEQDVPEPGVVDVATPPPQPNVIRKGFTTLHMARAFRQTLKNPEDYLVVELQDRWPSEGSTIGYYVAHKRDEL